MKKKGEEVPFLLENESPLALNSGIMIPLLTQKMHIF